MCRRDFEFGAIGLVGIAIYEADLIPYQRSASRPEKRDSQLDGICIVEEALIESRETEDTLCELPYYARCSSIWRLCVGGRRQLALVEEARLIDSPEVQDIHSSKIGRVDQRLDSIVCPGARRAGCGGKREKATRQNRCVRAELRTPGGSV